MLLIWLVWTVKLVAIDSFERYQADGGGLEARKLKGGKDYTKNVCTGHFNALNIVITKWRKNSKCLENGLIGIIFKKCELISQASSKLVKISRSNHFRWEFEGSQKCQWAASSREGNFVRDHFQYSHGPYSIESLIY